LKQRVVKGDFKPDNYQSERIFATAKDGSLVPISLVYRKDVFNRDGSNPLYLRGYGSYGDSFEPYFSISRLNLLDRGFVFAGTGIRGGSDMGEQWYKDGKLFNKKNTFTDFIACAEHLIENKYTNSNKLIASGGSAGGLLMGAVANMRPDLFSLIIADVPFVDVLNTMLDPSLSATVSEYDEWGNPQIKPYFDYIRSYCPYQNVKKQDYPPMLVLAGFHDPRVNYWEPAKWVAKLRANKTDNNLILLKTEMSSGHGGSSARTDYLREFAFRQAFMLDALNMD